MSIALTFRVLIKTKQVFSPANSILKKYMSELSFFALHIPTEGGQAEITGSCSAGRLKFLSDRRSEHAR